MAIIHITRLPIVARAFKFPAEIEAEAITLTSQAPLIKANEWAPPSAAAILTLLRKVATAAANIRRRSRNTEALRQWMLHERALPDRGHDAAETSRLSSSGSTPFGHYGFASLLFQNRSAGTPVEACGSKRGWR